MNGRKDGEDMTVAHVDEVTDRSASDSDRERYAELGELIVFHGGEWTEEDYLALPVGTRAELHDGRLILLPSPEAEHQFTIAELGIGFREIVGDRKRVFPEIDVRMADGTRYRTPDLVILRERGARKPFPPDKVLLVAEVVSPGGDERRQKLDAYRDAGIEWYLLLDPAPTPEGNGYSAELLRLEDGAYLPVAKAAVSGILVLPDPWNAELDLSRFVL